MGIVAQLPRFATIAALLAAIEVWQLLWFVVKWVTLLAPPLAPVRALLSIGFGCKRVEKELWTIDEDRRQGHGAKAGAIHGYHRSGLAVFHAVPYATAERFRHARLHTSATDGHFKAAFPRPWYVPAWMPPHIINTNPAKWAPISGGEIMGLTEQPVTLGVARLLWSNFRRGPGAWGDEAQALQLTVHQPLAVAGAGSPLVEKLRPVLVFIHGGAFVTMSQHMPLHRCENLARQTGCVVVSINYRMGVLGFAGFDDPAAGADANCGLVDCETALRWVQRYAHNFGGDAGKVTIMGESAGSFTCSCLTAMPRCKDLFSNVVFDSGVAHFPLSRSDGRATLRRFAEKLKLSSTTDQPALIAALRKASLTELMRLQKDVVLDFELDARNFVDMGGQARHFGPLVEPTILPTHPARAIEEDPSLVKGRSFVVSTTTSEFALFAFLGRALKGCAPLTDAIAAKRLRHLFDPASCDEATVERLVRTYRDTKHLGWEKHNRNPTCPLCIETYSDAFYRVPSEHFADKIIAGGGKAFVCRFAEPAAFPASLHAAHTVDLHYWLGNRLVPPYFNGVLPVGAQARRFDQVAGTMMELVGDVCWGRHVAAPVWRKRGDGPRGPVMIFGDPMALKNPEGAPVARVADTCEAACAGDDARTAAWSKLMQLPIDRTRLA